MGALTKALTTVADWVREGYPEEVARRIVSGELPMDDASRMARAQEQGGALVHPTAVRYTW